MTSGSQAGAEHGSQDVIFLISQPRAGSTLLQRMLGSHRAIFTTAEPWLLVGPLDLLREHGPEESLAQRTASLGVRGFIGALPDGVQDYYRGLRAMYGGLYAAAAGRAGRRWFLDKTPRYATALPELMSTFPDARYVFLVRNPLAVLVSIVRTWCTPNLMRLNRFRDDLLITPRAMAEGMRVARIGATVRYEELVLDPAGALGRACQGLGIEFDPAMLDYARADLPRWELGDQSNVYGLDGPREDRATDWTAELRAPQLWTLCRDYVDCLGATTVTALGYDPQELNAVLERAAPSRLRRLHCLPLRFWLHPWRRTLHRARKSIVRAVRYTLEVMRLDLPEFFRKIKKRLG